MASPQEKLAASLERLEAFQDKGQRVLRFDELKRADRERLVRSGFLREIVKGWLHVSSPDASPGDTTFWFASFWEFCARYCSTRFGDEWHVSPEQSLLLFAENTAIPKQIVIYTPRGMNNSLDLPFSTSLYDLKQKEMPAESNLSEWDGLRLFSKNAALLRVSAAFFASHPVEGRVLLSGIRDASEMLVRLLDGGHSVSAGRLAGAFRRIGRMDLADDILRAMKAAGHDVRETDPFCPEQAFEPISRTETPMVGRLKAMWQAGREPVLARFPSPPGLPRDKKAYLESVDGIYQSDAYHSLSIEGYRVTPDLIRRVRSGGWNPDAHAEDRRNRDALATRGYWQAFRLVRQTVEEIVKGGNPGGLVRAAHREWYVELFQPCAVAGLIAASDLAGYRNDAVYLRGSRHVPPRREVLGEAMSALFDLLEEETEPSVRATLGHWLFGYIHPYPDGNGRMARFIMNAMLASGGYPWTVIRVEDRGSYLAALEASSVGQDIDPFARFIAAQVGRSLEDVSW
ncbi:MAG: Fic family protein [Gammaproteobacteria bacterium]|nr:Fic family protein [Gammaproteobacteria bacterium]